MLQMRLRVRGMRLLRSQMTQRAGADEFISSGHVGSNARNSLDGVAQRDYFLVELLLPWHAKWQPL